MKNINGHMVIDAPVFSTVKGTPYLQEPGVALLGKQVVEPEVLRGLLSGFDPSLEFLDYLNDEADIPVGEEICKIAGQTCYASFSPKRTKNDGAKKYFDNIKSSGHGSVMEHAVWTFVIYGVSRSFSHELVRHRAGFGYSQLSQRYVDGKVLRFVEKKSFQNDLDLHELFTTEIDRAASLYHDAAQLLIKKQKLGLGILSADQKTDLRKKVNQDAREFLPNSTETIVTVTGNARAWRHFIEMRASEHAETQIREVAYRIYLCLREVAPIIFDDYKEVQLKDGTMAIDTPHRKV